jgi:hypothetical protein
MAGDGVEGADLGEFSQLILAKDANPALQVVDACKRK